MNNPVVSYLVTLSCESILNTITPCFNFIVEDYVNSEVIIFKLLF